MESAPGVDIVPGASPPSSVCHVGVKKSKAFHVAFFLNVSRSFSKSFAAPRLVFVAVIHVSDMMAGDVKKISSLMKRLEGVLHTL